MPSTTGPRPRAATWAGAAIVFVGLAALLAGAGLVASIPALVRESGGWMTAGFDGAERLVLQVGLGFLGSGGVLLALGAGLLRGHAWARTGLLGVAGLGGAAMAAILVIALTAGEPRSIPPALGGAATCALLAWSLTRRHVAAWVR